MVDGPNPPVQTGQDVPRLAVGVVDEVVKDCDTPQSVRVARVVSQREIVGASVMLHEELYAPRTVRRILSQHNGRHAGPAKQDTEAVCGHFALAQGVPVKVPQRPRTLLRLVHGQYLGISIGDGGHKGIV